MEAEIPNIVYQIIYLLASIVRYLGMAAFGLGIGWLTLDLLKKAQAWQLQIAVYLGLLGLVIAMARLLTNSSGIFVVGIAVAIFLWGMPKKKKEEKSE